MSFVVPESGKDKLLRYTDLLGKWNRTYNLTAIRDPLKMVTHHVLDSLAVVPPSPKMEVTPQPAGDWRSAENGHAPRSRLFGGGPPLADAREGEFGRCGLG